MREDGPRHREGVAGIPSNEGPEGDAHPLHHDLLDNIQNGSSNEDALDKGCGRVKTKGRKLGHGFSLCGCFLKGSIIV